MLRKTNLIQIVNNTQAEFITFSNYTEAMTGAVLSLHTHLVPTAFMCFNMEAAKTEMGRLLIKNILTYYYENKLAFLRDYMLDTDGVTFENDCHPLAYLLIALNMAETMFKTEQNVITTAPKAFTRAITNNNLDLVYVSEVTEQSYNGVFSDIILTVDSSDIKNYNITFNNDYNTRTQNIPESEKFDVKELYGWSYYNPKAEDSHGIPGNKWECKAPSGYCSNPGVKPIYDEDTDNTGYYNYRKEHSFRDITIDNNNKNTSVSFNVIVPLFDLINQDKVKDYKTLLDLTMEYSLNNANAVSRVPLGLYFTGDKNIELDSSNGTAPSWSLSLATQFAPFLYGKYSNPTPLDKTATANSFNSFTQTLTKQNNIIDSFTDTNNKIIDITNRVSNLQSMVNNIMNNIDVRNITSEIASIKTIIDSLKKQAPDSLRIDIDNINSELSQFRTNIKESVDFVKGVEDIINGFSKSINDLKRQVVNIDTNTENINEIQNRLDRDYNTYELHQELNELKNEVNELSGYDNANNTGKLSIKTISDNLAEYTDYNSSYKSGINKLFGISDELDRSNVVDNINNKIKFILSELCIDETTDKTLEHSYVITRLFEKVNSFDNLTETINELKSTVEAQQQIINSLINKNNN